MVMSAVIVYLRDLRHALPIILQLGLFATPVALALGDLVPARYALFKRLETGFADVA
jgi:ABC-2 type transport system permease protein/lipopolysaccharide transport system permease protein